MSAVRTLKCDVLMICTIHQVKYWVAVLCEGYKIMQVKCEGSGMRLSTDGLSFDLSCDAGRLQNCKMSNQIM